MKHEESHWGRFLTRFAFNAAALQHMWRGRPLRDLQAGLQSGRFHLRQEQLPSAMAMAMLAGAVLGAMFLTLEGLKTWRDAGTDAAELILVAWGVSRAEARELANAKLPALPGAPKA